MKAKIILSFAALFIASVCFSQQYSFSVFAFSIFDKEKTIEKLNHVFDYQLHNSVKYHTQSSAAFIVRSLFSNEGIDYHHFAVHQPGIWLLYAENVKKHRPLRYFSIEKKMKDGKIDVMRIVLNYDYHSCEMPCTFGVTTFRVCQIPFKPGTFMLMDIMKLSDWEKKEAKFIEISGDISEFMEKNEIRFWDIKMKK